MKPVAKVLLITTLVMGGTAFYIVGCSSKTGTMNSNRIVYEQGSNTMNEEEMYEYLISNATIKEKKKRKQKNIDLMGAMGKDTSSFPIVVGDDWGVCRFSENGMEIDELVLSELSVEEYADRLFEDYEQISIADSFKATENKDGTYHVECRALDESKKHVYDTGNYYIPEGFTTEVRDDGNLFGIGVLNKESSKKALTEYMKCFYFNYGQYDFAEAAIYQPAVTMKKERKV